jgi:hypothetical protein
MDKKQTDQDITKLSHRPIDYPYLSDKEKDELHQEILSALDQFFEQLKEEDCAC